MPNHFSNNNIDGNIENMNQFLLSYDERRMIDYYMNMYNQTMRQIDLLYMNLDEIRANMNQMMNRQFTNGRSIYNNHTNMNNHHTINRNRTRQRNNNTSNLRNEIVRPANNRRTPIFDSIFPIVTGTNENTRGTHTFFNNNNNIFDNLFTDVLVVPSQTQIERGTRIQNFGEIETPINSSCPITLERFENTTEVAEILGCGHLFNHTSLFAWFRNNTRCPICRYDIRTYIATNVSEEISSNELTSSPNEHNTIQDISLNHVNESLSITEEETNIENELLNTLSSMTENIMNHYLQNNEERIVFDNYMYDGSNNQVIFQGYIQNRN